MSINRIQFQPGLSLADFLKDFGTDAQCEAFVEQARWPRGLFAPTVPQPVPFSSDGAGRRSTNAVLAGNKCLWSPERLPRNQSAAFSMVYGEARSNTKCNIFGR